MVIIYTLQCLAEGPLLGTERIDLKIGEDTISFVPDTDNKYQFYYFPVKPRLAVKNYAGEENVPIFQFLKYNFDVKQARLNQGGIIQLAITLELPDKSLDEAKAKLAEKKGLDKKRISIGMIEITNSSMDLLVANTSDKLATSVLGNGPSIRHVGAIAPFVLEVTPEGSAVYEKMLKGTAGLGINFQYEYQGYTPYVDCRIVGTWDKVYEHYSKDTRAKASLQFWYYSVASEGRWTEIRDDLKNNTDVKIIWNNKPDENTPEGKRLVQLIEENVLLQIIKAVFDEKPPKADEAPAEASLPNSNGFYGGFNYGISVKDVKRRKTGSISFQYIGRSLIKVPGNKTGNFISVYPKTDKLKELMFINVEKDGFFNAVQINTSACINPTKFGIVSFKYIVTVGDTTNEIGFHPQKIIF